MSDRAEPYGTSLRSEQFEGKFNLKFSDLKEIKFRSGHRPRNATDYYYSTKSKSLYGYYFGDNPGKWDYAELNQSWIKSPSELVKPNETKTTIDQKENKCTYELELQIRKLELEKEIVKLNIELEKLKQNK